MDRGKLKTLEKSLDAAMEQFRVNCDFNNECSPEPPLKEHIHDNAKQTFYALGEFRDAILQALKE